MLHVPLWYCCTAAHGGRLDGCVVFGWLGVDVSVESPALGCWYTRADRIFWCAGAAPTVPCSYCKPTMTVWYTRRFASGRWNARFEELNKMRMNRADGEADVF